MYTWGGLSNALGSCSAVQLTSPTFLPLQSNYPVTISGKYYPLTEADNNGTLYPQQTTCGNEVDNEVTIHWHGLVQRNSVIMDGVAEVRTRVWPTIVLIVKGLFRSVTTILDAICMVWMVAADDPEGRGEGGVHQTALPPCAITIDLHICSRRPQPDLHAPLQVTQQAIGVGKSQVYSFIADSVGPFWYHSHFKAQYLDGLRGPILVNSRIKKQPVNQPAPIMVSDW